MLCSLFLMNVFEIFLLLLKSEAQCPGLGPGINSVNVNHKIYGIIVNMQPQLILYKCTSRSNL